MLTFLVLIFSTILPDCVLHSCEKRGKDGVIMIITSSGISMASSRNYQTSFSLSKQTSATFRRTGSVLSLFQAAKEKQESEAAKRSGETQGGKSYDSLQSDIIRRILNFIDSIKHGSNPACLPGNSYSFTSRSGASTSMAFVKTTVVSSFFYEEEVTAFKSEGSVTTADGRSIDLNITLEMSRSFCEEYKEITSEAVLYTDPLVINIDKGATSRRDMTFYFDIDCDGEKDEISMLDYGSGFLALDKNGDGKINDGSELFGTKSGDGFKDLSAYDLDGNGWIDEADDVFKLLKIWTKDEGGKDKLVSLKEAGVGAIHLGRALSEFSLNNAITNQSNALIKSTGVFLMEDGRSGTIQQVDLAKHNQTQVKSN